MDIPIKSRRTQGERSELTRLKVFEATSTLIRRRGFGDLSTEEVAREAGISRGALRHQFPTRNDLVLATLHHLDQQMRTASHARIAAVEAGQPLLDTFIDDARDYFFGPYFFMVLAVGSSDERNRPLRDATETLYHSSRLMIERSWDERFEASGLSAGLARDIAALTLSVVRGFGVRRLMRDDPDRFERLIGLWRQIVTHYLADALR